MRLTLFHILGMAGFLLVTAPAEAALYRWVDENGSVHYSDKVPAEQTKQGHQVLDREGRIVNKIAPEKTREELLLEKQEEAKRQEEERRLQLIRERDQMLLSTFVSVDDIDRVRDDRMAVLDSLIRLNEIKGDKLLSQLKEAEEKRVEYLKRGDELPEQLDKNIIELRTQVRNNQDLTLRHERRKQLIKEKFDLDKKRFLELLAEIGRRQQEQEAAQKF
jgi:hypothetical protein